VLWVFVSVYWCLTHTVLCFCFVFLRLVYPMFPVSLDCPFLIFLSVFSNVYLFLCLVYPMLPVSLGCPSVIFPSVFSNFYFLLLMQKLESLPGFVWMFFVFFLLTKHEMMWCDCKDTLQLCFKFILIVFML